MDKRVGKKSVSATLLVRLVICLGVLLAGFLVKVIFPGAADAASSAFFGEGSVKAAIAGIGGGESAAHVFASLAGQ